MKTKTTLTLMCIISLMQSITAQVPSGYTLWTIEPKQIAEEQKAIEFFYQKHPNGAGDDEFIQARRVHTKNAGNNTEQRAAQTTATASSCTNVDFEQGNMRG